MSDRPPPRAHVPGPPPPGWYPDPWHQAPHRWWTGSDWTGRTHDNRPARRESRLGLTTRIVLWSVGGIIGFFALIALIGSLGDGDSAPRAYDAAFTDAITRGADCAELFEIRNQINRETDHAHAERLNQRLRTYGCYSSGSTRDR